MERFMIMDDEQHLQQLHQQQQQQQPITALSLLEELMSSGLLLSDFSAIEEAVDHNDEENDDAAALLDIDISSTINFCERQWKRHVAAVSYDNDSNIMNDPPLFTSTPPDFVLAPRAESVASDLSSDDDDHEEEEDVSLQLGSLMNQPRPGLQEEEDGSIQQQQQQQHDSKMSLVSSQHASNQSQYRPGLQEDDDGDDGVRPPAEPVTVSTVASIQNTTLSSSSSSLSTSMHPVSPSSSTVVTTSLDWTFTPKPLSATSLYEEYNWRMRQAFGVVEK